MLGRRLKNWMTGTNERTQITQKVLEVRLDGLKQLATVVIVLPEWGDPKGPEPPTEEKSLTPLVRSRASDQQSGKKHWHHRYKPLHKH